MSSAIRTPDQTQLALLWQAAGAVDENRCVRSVIPPGNSLVDNARLFALINIAAADAAIIGFNSKYTYDFWRPYHAIRLADTNMSPGIMPDTNWNSLFLAPRFPEYISNHALITTALMGTAAMLLGDANNFTLSAPAYPGFTWNFTNFSEAIAQVKEARIWAGIHFRHSCDLGAATGTNLVNYIAAKSMQSVPGRLPVVNPTNTYEGKTYAEWSAEHWKWVYSLARDKHPLFDTADVSVGQTGDVWFLGGTYTTTPGTNGTIYATANRTCSIPQGTALFFPLIDAESSTAEGNGTNYSQLLAASQALIDTVDTLSCTIDGANVPDLAAYRTPSDLFTWGPLPANNVFGDPVDFPAGTSSQSVADGY
ncbi:MAG: vanadium-dependent haloperoxidase, partial [Limisphaerales bacterium]